MDHLPSDPNHLSPQDAFYPGSPPRKQREAALAGANGTGRRSKSRGRSAGRRGRGVWKKLLWIQQPYPDNYTDEETFLENLQLNPRLQLYDFWPLVADSTVIVQHACSVIIFVCCFVEIYQERISPLSVVSWGSLSTVLGWVLWDWWVGKEEAEAAMIEVAAEAGDDGSSSSSTTSSAHSGQPQLHAQASGTQGLGLTLSTSNLAPRHSHTGSAASNQSSHSATSPTSGHSGGSIDLANGSAFPSRGSKRKPLSARNLQRLQTAKSAILIFCAVLGLSPILKSLTKSTTSDSIWAMSCWLMCINVFFFDYGGGVGVKFPASLSTNAALMASTVLASRLPSTTHVFSLTLFSIEVFGLFPTFRRHLRHSSWRGHLALTLFLVMGAGGGVGVTISGGGWKGALIGVFMGGLLTAITMGGCSWWLIGLQKYKNEIHGPWDPARPVIRRHWD